LLEFYSCLTRCSTSTVSTLVDAFEYTVIPDLIDDTSRLTLKKVGHDALLTFILAGTPTTLRDAKNPRLRVGNISLSGLHDRTGLLTVALSGCFNLDSEINRSLRATFAFRDESGAVVPGHVDTILKDPGGPGGPERGCHGPEWGFTLSGTRAERERIEGLDAIVTIEDGTKTIASEIRHPFEPRRISFLSPADGALRPGAKVAVLWSSPYDQIVQGPAGPKFDLTADGRSSVFTANGLRVRPVPNGQEIVFVVPEDAVAARGRLRFGAYVALRCTAHANDAVSVPCESDPGLYSTSLPAEVLPNGVR
jgi:hypothetical protein